jgi:hypothetical protein
LCIGAFQRRASKREKGTNLEWGGTLWGQRQGRGVQKEDNSNNIKWFNERSSQPGMVVHTCNPSTE